MFRFIREHSGSMVFSVLLHVLIVVALVGGFIKFSSKPEVVQPSELAIQATVVDEKQVQAEMNRQQQEKEREQRQARERAEQLKREQQAEQDRLDNLKRQRETEEANERERVEQRRVAEQEGMMRVDDVRLERIQPVRQARRQRQPHGEFAAVEVLDRRHALDERLRFGRERLALERGRDHEHVVALPQKFFGEGAHRARHPSDVREVGVGHHANFHERRTS